MSVSWVILGIGNIGKTYDKTRHNIGFDVIESFLGREVEAERIKYEYSDSFKVRLADEEVILCMPNTYVNNSGLAAKEILDDYELSEKDLIVVVDDFHLPVGTLRYRGKGSAGGHNGLKSLIEHCGEEFTRLRFGIGPLIDGMSIVDFVLGQFSAEEREIVEETIPKAKDSLIHFLKEGLTSTMNNYNR